jgi:hypothetical protein
MQHITPIETGAKYKTTSTTTTTIATTTIATFSIKIYANIEQQYEVNN